jgi:hypothetical protein
MKIVNFVTVSTEVKPGWFEEKQHRIIRSKKLTYVGAARIIAKRLSENGAAVRPSDIRVVRIETMLWA